MWREEERSPLKQDSYWFDPRNDPQTHLQRMGQFADDASELIDIRFGALHRALRAELRAEKTAALKAIADFRRRCKELDEQWCDTGHWRDTGLHRAYCCPSDTDEDERDRVREALRAGAVYGGAPAPGEAA